MLFEVSMLFLVRRQTRADEAAVCMLNNDLEPFLIETLWILRGGWTHCSRNVFAPVSLTEVSSSLLETEGQSAIGLQDATSSATPASDGVGKCFRLFPSSHRARFLTHAVAGHGGLQWRQPAEIFQVMPFCPAIRL